MGLNLGLRGQILRSLSKNGICSKCFSCQMITQVRVDVHLLGHLKTSGDLLRSTFVRRAVYVVCKH